MRSPETGGSLDVKELIAILSSPETYAHPVSGLHVVQTHTSCVALTGELVYKIKKPVDFGFLDYSTLERRRVLCEEEVRLNRRLCPEVYLDVVPLVRQDGALRFGAAGSAVEWAVRMRQLPEADLLPARLAAGTVDPQQIRQLAGLLADFHSQSPAHTADRFGSPAQVAANARENLTLMERLVGAELPEPHVAAIAEYTERFLVEQRELLESRVREGWIREGHGDLRAQNICLYPGIQGGIQILDCIEFNERFRYGDAAADLAYLAMDLDLAGRRDLRETLATAYEHGAGDTGLRRVLPFYLCYRACVRGKIALLAANEPEVPVAERATHRALAAAAFDLAHSYAEGARPPAAWILTGFSGSGKSVLARELARRIPAVWLRSDQVRKELAGVTCETRLADGSYIPEAVSAVYRELRQRARSFLQERIDVILDATFLTYDERERARELAKELGAAIYGVECVCPDVVIRQRLMARAAAGGDPSDAGVAVYESQLSRREAPEPCEGFLPVRTDREPGEVAREVLALHWSPHPTAA